MAIGAWSFLGGSMLYLGEKMNFSNVPAGPLSINTSVKNFKYAL